MNNDCLSWSLLIRINDVMFHFNFILVLSWVNFWGVTLADGLVNLTNYILWNSFDNVETERERETNFIYESLLHAKENSSALIW